MKERPPMFAYDPLTGQHTDVNQQKPIKFGVQHTVTADRITKMGEPALVHEVKRALSHQLADGIVDVMYDAVEREYDDQRFLTESFRLEVYLLTKAQWREMCHRLQRIEHENRLLKSAALMPDVKTDRAVDSAAAHTDPAAASAES